MQGLPGLLIVGLFLFRVAIRTVDLNHVLKDSIHVDP